METTDWKLRIPECIRFLGQDQQKPATVSQAIVFLELLQRGGNSQSALRFCQSGHCKYDVYRDLDGPPDARKIKLQPNQPNLFAGCLLNEQPIYDLGPKRFQDHKHILKQEYSGVKGSGPRYNYEMCDQIVQEQYQDSIQYRLQMNDEFQKKFRMTRMSRDNKLRKIHKMREKYYEQVNQPQITLEKEGQSIKFTYIADEFQKQKSNSVIQQFNSLSGSVIDEFTLAQMTLNIQKQNKTKNMASQRKGSQKLSDGAASNHSSQSESEVIDEDEQENLHFFQSNYNFPPSILEQAERESNMFKLKNSAIINLIDSNSKSRQNTRSSGKFSTFRSSNNHSMGISPTRSYSPQKMGSLIQISQSNYNNSLEQEFQETNFETPIKKGQFHRLSMQKGQNKGSTDSPNNILNHRQLLEFPRSNSQPNLKVVNQNFTIQRSNGTINQNNLDLPTNHVHDPVDQNLILTQLQLEEQKKQLKLQADQTEMRMRYQSVVSQQRIVVEKLALEFQKQQEKHQIQLENSLDMDGFEELLNKARNSTPDNQQSLTAEEKKKFQDTLFNLKIKRLLQERGDFVKNTNNYHQGYENKIENEKLTETNNNEQNQNSRNNIIQTMKNERQMMLFRAKKQIFDPPAQTTTSGFFNTQTSLQLTQNLKKNHNLN